jgi:DNA-binding CsgD family transcriptional regulator
VQELARTGRLSRERLSTLVGAMPDAVVLTDPAGEIEAVSEAWVELLGQVGDSVGLSIVTICRWQLGREAAVRVEQLLRRASVRQVPQRALLPAVPRHGQIAVTATPLVTPVVGGIEHAVLVFGREQEPHETDEDAVELVHELTGRELDVLRGLAEGRSPREVAQQLSLCDSTVRGYVKSLLQKLRVHSQLQAVLVGMQAGVVPVPDGAGRPDGGGAGRPGGMARR